MTFDPVRFPVGPVQAPPAQTAAQLTAYAASLQKTGAQLEQRVSGLDEEQLERRYRAGSFTVRQLVHHIADGHQQGLMRFRWGLTGDTPTILPMDPDGWAALADYRLPPAVSLAIFAGVNTRWVTLLGTLDPQRLTRTVVRPGDGPMTLWQLLARHDWHARHHLGHIRLALG
ncbi:YfiT family bacillithiol transferase [Deinococcus sonorensis]|uniref:YfiT family bacillithiol transferase n=2 Tax=Deinococcus sonorensis TaxID=309891 RepID=A0AAU7UEV5_9DEIO